MLALSIVLSLYVFETTRTVATDVSYTVPIKITAHPEIVGQAYYALVASEDLKPAMKVWQTPDEDGVFQVDKANPDGAPPMTALDIQTTTIAVPKFEMRSPLLGRKISTEQPFQHIVIYTKHRYGCSYKFVGEGNWNQGQQIKIDLNSSIERARQMDAAQ
ncbi:hypothetical protein MFFC18_13460 [Mariniblastus fucicola]|uniref:Uncharacterized protein n=2 Tax=Mariniblastus fucicola TaxID=980251 RepID=A0A5B9P9C3_9BACT|nr:hypothetical protein MFFC18_13460 [Mariniblastus fucicola]